MNLRVRPASNAMATIALTEARAEKAEALA
jgi:hypothetical protein